MKNLIVLGLMMGFIAGSLMAQEDIKLYTLFTKEELKDINKVLDKISVGMTNEDYYAIPKEERERFNSLLYEKYKQTENKELEEIISLFCFSPAEKRIIKFYEDDRKRISTELTKIVKKVYADFNREKNELIEKCLWAGFWVGRQGSSREMTRKIKEMKDNENLTRRIRDIEDLLGFIITDIERRRNNNLDIRIKPPR